MKHTMICLCALFLLSSCGATAGTFETEALPKPGTVPEETEGPASVWNLPIEDYNGYNFRILTYANMYQEHRADALDGDVLNDALYERNLFVSDTYNVEITVDDMGDANYQSTLRKSVSAGDDAYDLYQIFLSAAAQNYVPGGYFVDWHDIPVVNEHLSEDWWNPGGQGRLAVAGHEYLMTGDLAHLYIGDATGLYFNKELFRQADFEFPYQDVLDGTWTLDKLLALCEGYNRDLNGDGKMSYDDDLYAFMSTMHIAPIGMFVGCDLKTLYYDDTGYPHLNLLTERTLNAYEKIYHLTVDNDCSFEEYNMNLMAETSVSLFSEGRSLFLAAYIDAASVLRSMDQDFGIIPYPKYDEAQENYISSIDAGVSAAAVAITASDLNRSGLILEALCEKGHELVIPAYFDTLLQGKSTRDEESFETLNIIRQTAAFDPLYVYNFGNLGFCFRTWLTGKKTDIASLYTKSEKNAEKAIAKFWEKIEALT